MASSDEEGEILPQYITDYYCIDQNDTPISFTLLPIHWGGELPVDLEMQVYLIGSCGYRKTYKRIIAWKFELCHEEPEVYVLSKDKNWMNLRSPRKSFEKMVRTILVTIGWLHFIRRNPEAEEDYVWTNLMNGDRSDLSEHTTLIVQAAESDRELSKSKHLLAFLGKPSETVAVHEDDQFKKESEEEKEGKGDDGDNEDQMDIQFDPACSICDNGGTVLNCEGRCMRSFHPTVADGIDSFCASLGITDSTQVEEIPIFLCKNCLFKQHQCNVCGRLGSSDESSTQEVFPCFAASCGRFYHPECVAKLLHADDRSKAEQLRRKIAMKEPFSCPLHRCFVCKLVENQNVHELQFAMCRRCPKAYHRKCLPRKITYGGYCDENNPRRAWDGLLPYNRVLIYCLDHEIIPELETPIRNHIIFPDVAGDMRMQTLGLPSVKQHLHHDNSATKTAEEEAEQPEKLLGHAKSGGSPDKLEKKSVRTDFDLNEQIVVEGQRNILKGKGISASCSAFRVGNSTSSPRRQRKLTERCGKTSESTKRPLENKLHVAPQLDTDAQNRLRALMKEAASSVSFKELIKIQNDQDDTPQYRSRYANATLGLIEGHVNAVRAAVKMLEKGCSLEEAKAICEPETLIRLINMKKKLEVHLAPFILGPRYTSFGRHFTKLEKLKEIVDRLCWYVQNGDMIVDFACGANDFSCLMKERLDEMGKLCRYKNYDLFCPKRDFNFEQRDWMSVNIEELPNGSQLIMGLNPPFGVRAGLANNFVAKALQFKPKLLILIVPKETRRLDEGAVYDLIWQDEQIVAGKSFYLPGSVDIHHKPLEQWNLKPPSLYLWSRRDWTSRHRAIAHERDHIRRSAQIKGLEQNYSPQNSAVNHPRDDAQGSCTRLSSCMEEQVPNTLIAGNFETNLWHWDTYQYQAMNQAKSLPEPRPEDQRVLSETHDFSDDREIDMDIE